MVPNHSCIRAQVEWLKLKSRYDGHDLLDLLRAIRNSFEHLFERTPGAEDETRRRAVVRAMTGWAPAQMDAAHRSREIRAEARPNTLLRLGLSKTLNTIGPSPGTLSLR